MQDFCLDAILFPEFFWGANNEFFFRIDDPADIIGDPSGGKRGVGTPLKDDDVQLGPKPLCLGGGAHPRSIPTDNNQSFVGHDFPP